MTLKLPKSREFQSDLNQFQYLIGVNLLKTNRRPVISLKMNISEVTCKFLVKNFKLNYGRFKTVPDFLRKTGLFYENRSSKKIRHTIDSENFRMKLIKPKSKILAVKNKAKLEYKIIKSLPIVSVKFERLEMINLSKIQKRFYLNYN